MTDQSHDPQHASPDPAAAHAQQPADKPIVVGVDGSEDSRRALMYAYRAATERQADLFIVHAVDDAVLAGAWGVVYDPTLLQQAGQTVLDDAVKVVVDAGMPADRVSSDVVMGNPAGVLTRVSEEAQLLVVGRRSVTGLERLFVGSTSVGVAASAHCPVIMVSAATNVAHTGGLHRIGVGVETHPTSAIALEAAFREARTRGATLEIIHAWGQPTGLFARQLSQDKLAQIGRAARDGIAELVAPQAEKFPEVQHEVHVVQAANAVDELVQRSARLDLLVLGVHASGLGGVGGVVRGVMAHARCPLAMVHNRP